MIVGLQSKNVEPVGSSEAADGDFRKVSGGDQQTSGEILLIEAYAAIWLVVFAMVFMSIRRQKKLDERIDQLSSDLAKARKGGGG